MRNITVLLMCMTLFVVTLSRDIHARNADSDNGALLEAFVKAVEEGKLDINNLVQDKRADLNKRWFISSWFSSNAGNSWMPKIGGKK